MPLHYTLRLNVITATPEYRDNTAGYMFSLSTRLYAKAYLKWIIPNRSFDHIRDIDKPLDEF